MWIMRWTSRVSSAGTRRTVTVPPLGAPKEQGICGRSWWRDRGDGVLRASPGAVQTPAPTTRGRSPHISSAIETGGCLRLFLASKIESAFSEGDLPPCAAEEAIVIIGV